MAMELNPHKFKQLYSWDRGGRRAEHEVSAFLARHAGMDVMCVYWKRHVVHAQYQGARPCNRVHNRRSLSKFRDPHFNTLLIRRSFAKPGADFVTGHTGS